MQRWINKLINLGVTPKLSFEQVRSVKVLNLVALLTIASAFAFLVTNAFYGKYLLSVLNGITLSSGVVMLVLHSKNHYEHGYLVLSGVASVVFFTSGLLYHNNMEFYLLLITILSIIVMKDIRISLTFGVINLLAFLFVYKYGHQFNYQAEVGDERRVVNIIIWQILLLIIARYFNIQGLNRQKQIEEKNDLLEQNKQQLEESNRKLQVLNSTKEKLFSIVAHDVRSPIAGVKGVLELFTQNGITNAELKELSVQMVTQIDQLQSNLDNLLQWSRSQLDGIETNTEKIDLSGIVNETLKLLQHNLTSKNIHVDVRISANTMVLADGNQLQIILRNLLSNAIKFSYESSVIYISATSSQNLVLLRIKDEGTGIKPAVLETLFDESQLATTEYGTNNEKGHGIGLLLCKEFAQRNNGSIRVESEYGKGSVFILELPC